MWLACAAVWGHVDVWAHAAAEGLRFYCSWGLCWCPWPMSLKSMMVSAVCAVEQSHVDILSLCCCQVLWWCPRPMQWQRAMLMSMVCAVTSDHVEVHGACWHWRPYGCLWSVLSPGTMCKSMIHVPTDYKGWGNYFCHGVADYRLPVEKGDIEGLCDNPYSHYPILKITA